MRRFAEIHQAKSKNKQPHEAFYFIADNDPRLGYPRLTLKNVFSSIITITGDVTITSDYYIYFSNVYVLLYVWEKYVYFIVRGKLSDSCPILTWLNLLLYLENGLVELSYSLSWQETHAIFHIWDPFGSGIIGFGVGNNLSLNIAPSTFIYRNQTSHIDTTNQSIIAYIQEEFLGSITEDIPQTRADGFIAYDLY